MYQSGRAANSIGTSDGSGKVGLKNGNRCKELKFRLRRNQHFDENTKISSGMYGQGVGGNLPSGILTDESQKMMSYHIIEKYGSTNESFIHDASIHAHLAFRQSLSNANKILLTHRRNFKNA